MDLYFKCVFFFLFFMSIGHHCVFRAQIFLQEKFVPRCNIQTFIYLILKTKSKKSNSWGTGNNYLQVYTKDQQLFIFADIIFTV